MSAPWNFVEIDVLVDWNDVDAERERLLELGADDLSNLTVRGEVDLDDALEEATDDQLRAALSAPEYTQEQLDAIRDCFTAIASGHELVALSLLNRVFEHQAQVIAAENGIRSASHARAA